MYRNLRPLFELTQDDFVDPDQILVWRFFRRLGRKIPAWLAPSFLRHVAAEASAEDFMITRRILRSINPDGTPWWR